MLGNDQHNMGVSDDAITIGINHHIDQLDFSPLLEPGGGPRTHHHHQQQQEDKSLRLSPVGRPQPLSLSFLHTGSSATTQPQPSPGGSSSGSSGSAGSGFLNTLFEMSRNNTRASISPRTPTLNISAGSGGSGSGGGGGGGGGSGAPAADSSGSQQLSDQQTPSPHSLHLHLQHVHHHQQPSSAPGSRSTTPRTGTAALLSKQSPRNPIAAVVNEMMASSRRRSNSTGSALLQHRIAAEHSRLTLAHPATQQHQQLALPSSGRSRSSSTASTASSGAIDGIITKKTKRKRACDHSKTVCSRCGVNKTPMWRRGENDVILCNKCGLYWARHRTDRPLNMEPNRSRQQKDGKAADKKKKKATTKAEPAKRQQKTNQQQQQQQKQHVIPLKSKGLLAPHRNRIESLVSPRKLEEALQKQQAMHDGESQPIPALLQHHQQQQQQQQATIGSPHLSTPLSIPDDFDEASMRDIYLDALCTPGSSSLDFLANQFILMNVDQTTQQQQEQQISGVAGSTPGSSDTTPFFTPIDSSAGLFGEMEEDASSSSAFHEWLDMISPRSDDLAVSSSTVADSSLTDDLLGWDTPQQPQHQPQQQQQYQSPAFNPASLFHPGL